jgi:hypothetical protein
MFSGIREQKACGCRYVSGRLFSEMPGIVQEIPE